MLLLDVSKSSIFCLLWLSIACMFVLIMLSYCKSLYLYYGKGTLFWGYIDNCFEKFQGIAKKSQVTVNP